MTSNITKNYYSSFTLITPLLVFVALFSTNTVAQPLEEKREVSIGIGLSYAMDSTTNGLFSQRERTTAIPLSLSVGINSELTATLGISAVSSSTERITIDDVVNTDSTGIGDVGLGIGYYKKTDSKSMWPSYTFNVGVVLPTGDAANETEVGSSGTGNGVKSADVGFGFVKSLDPVAMFLNFGLGYNSEYTRSLITIRPGRLLTYGFGFSFSVNNKIVLTSRVQGSVESDLRVNNVRIRGTSSETIQIGTDLKYQISPVHSISPSLNFGLAGGAGGASISVNYAYKL